MYVSANTLTFSPSKRTILDTHTRKHISYNTRSLRVIYKLNKYTHTHTQTNTETDTDTDTDTAHAHSHSHSHTIIHSLFLSLTVSATHVQIHT